MLAVAGVGAALACLCSLVVLRLVMQRKNSMDRCRALVTVTLVSDMQPMLDNVAQKSEKAPSLCLALVCALCKVQASM